ncbi:trypsin domain-containing protein [Phthorimaea operculella]|nr:trypsin domain-containing protein [Phthorimaea operculella]
MRGILLVCLASVALASGLQEADLDLPVRPVFGYHDNHGIPLAKQMKEDEEAFFKKAAESGSRVVGGEVAPAGAYPYLAGLIITMPNTPNPSVCGATLVSANRLITAAHCWFDGVRQAVQFEVVLGSQFLFSGEGTRIVAERVVMHPQWNTQTLANDIAMIYLPRNVEFSDTIQPAALPDSYMLFLTWVGWWGQAAGYGRINDREGVTTATQVNHVRLQIIDEYDCAVIYSPEFVRSSTLCTNGFGGVGICTGDSGGPLTIRYQDKDFLMGVSSFVSRDGCEIGLPSAFSRVTSHIPWILQHLDN